ncbi:hypothetical protein HDV01_003569 [Terramyces sp. JEL0728]|nr:hypothetical protein HDV01_003569 [Terramyces sp. JEL0728]
MSTKAISPRLEASIDYSNAEELVIQEYTNEIAIGDTDEFDNQYQIVANYNQNYEYGVSEQNGYQNYRDFNDNQLDIPENPSYTQNEKTEDFSRSPRFANEQHRGYNGVSETGEQNYGYGGYTNEYQQDYSPNQYRQPENIQPLPNQPRVVRRSSLDELKDVVNGLDGSYVQDEFGKIDNPGGLFKIIPLETQLNANYFWDIPIDSLQEEKLVLYPKGTGETQGLSMSAFLRPLKNELESANENWARPISKFIFCIKKSFETQGEYGAEFEENYVTQYSQDDFKEFSQTVNGWGFQDFCSLPLNESEVRSANNTIRISAQVHGPLLLKTSTILYEQPISLPITLGQELETNAFGPATCQWQVKLVPISDEFGKISCVSGYLYPVKSKFENSLGQQWDRVISTFTLKLVDKYTSQTICSKSLTGGFVFTEDNLFSGWDTFMSIEDALSTNLVILHAEVTWDPNSLNENTVLGKLKAALQNSIEEKNQTQQRIGFLETELVKFTENEQSLSQYIQRLNSQLNEQQTALYKNQLASQELENLRQRVTLLTTELEDARNEQVDFYSTNVRLSTAKARIAEIRTKMDSDDIQPPVMPGDIHAELAHYKSQLAQVFHEKAQVDLKLSQSLSELHFVQRSKKDEVLLAPIQNHEHLIHADNSIDPQQKIIDAIDTSRIEISAGKAVLEEVNAKTAVLQLTCISKTEKSGLIAEISMIQCQLDVAAATMYELEEEYLADSPNAEFSTVLAELEEVRTAMAFTRESIEKGKTVNLSPKKKYETPAGVAPPPILPSVNHPKSRKSYVANEAVINSSEAHVNDNNFKVLQPQFDFFTGKLDSVVDLIKNTLSTPRESVVNAQKFELQIESWAPKEDSDSKLDAGQLQILLKELKRNQSQKYLSFLSFFALLAMVYFSVYSTIFIVCDPSNSNTAFKSYQPVCNTVVTPLWENVKDKWHQSCEKLALEILPSYAKKFTIGAKRIQGIKGQNSGDGENIHPKDHNVPKTSFPTGAPVNPSDSATFSHLSAEVVEELYPAVIPIIESAIAAEVDLTTSSATPHPTENHGGQGEKSLESFPDIQIIPTKIEVVIRHDDSDVLQSKFPSQEKEQVVSIVPVQSTNEIPAVQVILEEPETWTSSEGSTSTISEQHTESSNPAVESPALIAETPIAAKEITFKALPDETVEDAQATKRDSETDTTGYSIDLNSSNTNQKQPNHTQESAPVVKAEEPIGKKAIVTDRREEPAPIADQHAASMSSDGLLPIVDTFSNDSPVSDKVAEEEQVYTILPYGEIDNIDTENVDDRGETPVSSINELKFETDILDKEHTIKPNGDLYENIENSSVEFPSETQASLVREDIPVSGNVIEEEQLYTILPHGDIHKNIVADNVDATEEYPHIFESDIADPIGEPNSNIENNQDIRPDGDVNKNSRESVGEADGKIDQKINDEFPRDIAVEKEQTVSTGDAEKMIESDDEHTKENDLDNSKAGLEEKIYNNVSDRGMTAEESTSADPPLESSNLSSGSYQRGVDNVGENEIRDDAANIEAVSHSENLNITHTDEDEIGIKPSYDEPLPDNEGIVENSGDLKKRDELPAPEEDTRSSVGKGTFH